jgi:hypothetical protein
MSLSASDPIILCANTAFNRWRVVLQFTGIDFDVVPHERRMELIEESYQWLPRKDNEDYDWVGEQR